MDDMALYESIRSRIKTGDLLLWHTHNPLGAAIRLVRKSNINHASVVIRLREFETEDDLILNCEAVQTVETNLLSRRLGGHDGECWWHPMLGEMREIIGDHAMTRRALKYTGLGYDTSTLFRMATSRPLMDDTTMICSELVQFIVGYTGNVLAPDELLNMGYHGKGEQIL